MASTASSWGSFPFTAVQQPWPFTTVGKWHFAYLCIGSDHLDPVGPMAFDQAVEEGLRPELFMAATCCA